MVELFIVNVLHCYGKQFIILSHHIFINNMFELKLSQLCYHCQKKKTHFVNSYLHHYFSNPINKKRYFHKQYSANAGLL